MGSVTSEKKPSTIARASLAAPTIRRRIPRRVASGYQRRPLTGARPAVGERRGGPRGGAAGRAVAARGGPWRRRDGPLAVERGVLDADGDDPKTGQVFEGREAAD